MPFLLQNTLPVGFTEIIPFFDARAPVRPHVEPRCGNDTDMEVALVSSDWVEMVVLLS